MRIYGCLPLALTSQPHPCKHGAPCRAPCCAHTRSKRQREALHSSIQQECGGKLTSNPPSLCCVASVLGLMMQGKTNLQIVNHHTTLDLRLTLEQVSPYSHHHPRTAHSVRKHAHSLFHSPRPAPLPQTTAPPPNTLPIPPSCVEWLVPRSFQRLPHSC
jgi:hypothetical protein